MSVCQSNDDLLELLRTRETIMHRWLDKIGAPREADWGEHGSYKLNINGRMEEFVRAHPEVVVEGLEHFHP